MSSYANKQQILYFFYAYFIYSNNSAITALKVPQGVPCGKPLTLDFMSCPAPKFKKAKLSQNFEYSFKKNRPIRIKSRICLLSIHVFN